ncbi:hypothetical protein [Granulicella tundricola]|uniref:Lipoprotein n=1 Tax=Granulicella tundricola (strain ATCC BAA-1859 / DSM 23138 / MP5ACTX9) TaxID=1198114 RepID=E8X7T8_GRATM|nr:hypothetical protein [Granulicella tundricola]ADW71522.1 hypothetical protein AciX9_4592 [Granulicella tundricola MP5ACTX9]
MKNGLEVGGRFVGNVCLGIALAAAGLGLGGCKVGSSGGSGGTGGGGGTSDPNHVYATGNWQIQATPTKGVAPFTSLGGFINEQGTDPGINDLTTGAFQAQSTSCYVNTPTVPLQGAVLAYQLGLRSFAVDGQFLTISAAEDATVTHMTGTYSITGGCADGATGNLAGTKYAALSGTYKGSVTAGTTPETMQLVLSQFQQGTGDGVFLVSGNASFTGFSCFNQASLASADGGIAGSAVNLSFVTNDPTSARLLLTGTITSDAKTFNVSSAMVTGGNCAGSIGTAVLTQQ